jgi:hypothetical protein
MNSASLDNVISAVKIKGTEKALELSSKILQEALNYLECVFENLKAAITWMGLSLYLLIKGCIRTYRVELIKITNKDKVRLNSSLIERQVYQGSQQPKLLNAEYSSAIANTTTDGIHWLNNNKVI